MTDNPEPPETPGMSEVSPKFVDEAAATTRIAQDAINAVLDKIPPRSGDETQIAHIYRKLLAMRAGRPRDLSDDDMAMWVDEHDHMEAAIGRLEARNTQDVDIKLAVLCDRLREAEAGDLLIAQAARDDLKKLLMAPSPASAADNALMALVVDYYAAYIARDAATDAREEVEHQAEKLDSEAIRIEGVPTSGGPDRLFLPFLFDKAGTLTPSREQVSQYCETDKLTEAVMRHLEEYGERCVAALEAAGWPEKQVEYERAEQRVDTLFDQMVQTPAQGLRGIAAKIKGLVYPHEWEFLRDGKLDDFDDEINTEMFVSLVADVERLAGEAAPITKLVIEDPVLVLKREWEARYQLLDEQRDTGDDSDEARQPFYDRLDETESQILQTQATTPAGIAVKLILWARQHLEAGATSGLSWNRVSIEGKPLDLDRQPVISALHDLERMSQGIAPSTTEEPEIDNKGVTTRGLDPVAQIGRDLTTIWRQVWQNEEEVKSAKAHSPESTRLERLESHLADRREALEAMAAEIQASTLEGVMVQIMLAHAEADMMAASTEESNEAQMRTVSKLLYSALAALERLAGVPREKLGGEAYLTRELDPHALVAGDETKSTA